MVDIMLPNKKVQKKSECSKVSDFVLVKVVDFTENKKKFVRSALLKKSLETGLYEDRAYISGDQYVTYQKNGVYFDIKNFAKPDSAILGIDKFEIGPYLEELGFYSINGILHDEQVNRLYRKFLLGKLRLHRHFLNRMDHELNESERQFLSDLLLMENGSSYEPDEEEWPHLVNGECTVINNSFDQRILDKRRGKIN